MKKLKTLKNITLSLFSLTMLFGSVLPVMAANSDESDTEMADAKDAIDVDFSTLQIGDQFKDYEGITYTVDDLSANIYVGSGDNQKLYPSGSSEIPNFEITYVTKSGEPTWRKYVKLYDLCNLTRKDGTHICEVMSETDENKGEFFLRRLYRQKIYSSSYQLAYEEGFDEPADAAKSEEISIYYRSYHNIGTKRFEAMLRLVKGDNDEDVVNTYIFDEGNITSDQGTWSTGQSTIGNDDVSVLSTDIETLRDRNGVIYVSLRFVSESLGAEVTWYSKEDSKTKDDDDVVIQFYDDKEYCKDIDFTITYNNTQMNPKDIEKMFYTQKGHDEYISLDGIYNYTNNKGNRVDNTVAWKKVYILLTKPETYNPSNFEDSVIPLEKNVLWKQMNNGEYHIVLTRQLYGELSSQDGTCQVGDEIINCNQNEKIDITGIILYNGVPIPIDIFNINNEYCSTNR